MVQENQTERKAAPEQTQANQGTPAQPTLEALQKQLAELSENSKKLEENWKNEQRVSSKKEQELQRLREQTSNIDANSDMMKALVAVIAQQKQESADVFEDEVKQKQPDLLKAYDEIAKKSKQQRDVERLSAKLREIQADTETLGLKEGSDDYDFIKAMAESGKFDKAEQRLEKLKGVKQVAPTEKPAETEEQKIERLVNDKLKAILGDKLKQDGGTPSGGTATFTAEQIASMSTEEYKEKRADIMKAYSEGKVSKRR